MVAIRFTFQGDSRLVVTGIAYAVAVEVFLAGVRIVRTVVHVTAHAVAVRIVIGIEWAIVQCDLVAAVPVGRRTDIAVFNLHPRPNLKDAGLLHPFFAVNLIRRLLPGVR